MTMIKYLNTEEEFNDIINNKVLIDFYADWCGPCKMISPILEEINDIDILKVNVDNYPDLAKKYGVMSIPTLILFNNGNEINKIIGLHSKEEILSFIEPIK